MIIFLGHSLCVQYFNINYYSRLKSAFKLASMSTVSTSSARLSQETSRGRILFTSRLESKPVIETSDVGEKVET